MISQRVLQAVNRLGDPVYVTYALAARFNTSWLFDRYRRLAETAGLKQLYFVLSFDCDIEDDISVVRDMHSRLIDMGVRPVYAVPGELLQKGEATYRSILDAGGEFINHGYREHTFFDERRGEHASCFFYNEQDYDVVRDDIVSGDRNLRQVLGVKPQGFRAPHFGTYQKSWHLTYLHSVLKELGYLFSTSTVPLFSYRFGPVFDHYGVMELPVSAMGGYPLRILDTWGCFAAPYRKFTPADYRAQGRQAAERFLDLGVGVLNYYADPSHIHDRPEFFSAVAHWASVAKSVTYNELLQDIV